LGIFRQSELLAGDDEGPEEQAHWPFYSHGLLLFCFSPAQLLSVSVLGNNKQNFTF